MSDQLFQNTDEQEAAFAPQQLPAGNPQERDAAIEEGDTGVGPAAALVAPVAAGGALAGGGATGQIGTSAPSNAPAVGPAIAGAALAGDRSDESDATATANEGTENSTGQTPSG